MRGTGKEKVRFTEAFNEGRWQTLPPEDRLKLSKTDAQIWISLHNLVTDPKCRGKYRYDDFRSYLYVSTDYGVGWEPIASDLPAEPVNVIAEDPENADMLYVGTDAGVYVSLDRGASWHSLCSNLPTTPVYDLTVHPRDGELVIGTHGRSIFVSDVSAIRSRAGAR